MGHCSAEDTLWLLNSSKELYVTCYPIVSDGTQFFVMKCARRAEYGNIN